MEENDKRHDGDFSRPLATRAAAQAGDGGNAHSRRAALLLSALLMGGWMYVAAQPAATQSTGGLAKPITSQSTGGLAQPAAMQTKSRGSRCGGQTTAPRG